ncbi:MAG TPA: acetyltransferase [Magnetospirillum sp.]|nr:acetyltransferase [Magnetospirillum sp.]
MSLPFIILGGGGHALVVLDVLESMGASVRGYCDPQQSRHLPATLEWIGNDDDLLALGPQAAVLACGIGSTGSAKVRRAVFERFSAAGFGFPALRHASATVSPRAQLGDGTVVMMGACVQPGARIGKNVIVNTGSRIDHDCVVGDHSHVAPGATLAGAVTLGEGVHVGAGATVIQNKSVGIGAVVGAGACVVGDVPGGALVIGVPARERRADSNVRG